MAHGFHHTQAFGQTTLQMLLTITHTDNTQRQRAHRIFRSYLSNGYIKFITNLNLKAVGNTSLVFKRFIAMKGIFYPQYSDDHNNTINTVMQ